MTAIQQGPQLFGRIATVQFGTIVPGQNVQVTGLRTSFDIAKTASRETNKISLSVYNLAQNTRKQIRAQNVPVVVTAGYVGYNSQIFNGTIRAIEHIRDGTEWVTKITGGDGETPRRLNRINQSWKPGTSISTILTQIGQATGFGLGNLPTIASQGNFRKNMQQFQRGYVAHGPAYYALHKLVSSLGYMLSIQDGSLMIVATTNANVDVAVQLNGTSGLVGSPEVGERNLLKVTSLLNGALYPQRKVMLQSANFNGLYKVISLHHKGDTHGKDWYTVMLLQGLTQPLTGHPTGDAGGGG
jgi:Baseplate hub gp41